MERRYNHKAMRIAKRDRILALAMQRPLLMGVAMLLCVPGLCASDFLGTLAAVRSDHMDHRSTAHASPALFAEENDPGDHCEDDRCCQAGVNAVSPLKTALPVGYAVEPASGSPSVSGCLTATRAVRPRGPPGVPETPLRC